METMLIVLYYVIVAIFVFSTIGLILVGKHYIKGGIIDSDDKWMLATFLSMLVCTILAIMGWIELLYGIFGGLFTLLMFALLDGVGV